MTIAFWVGIIVVSVLSILALILMLLEKYGKFCKGVLITDFIAFLYVLICYSTFGDKKYVGKEPYVIENVAKYKVDTITCRAEKDTTYIINYYNKSEFRFKKK